MQFQFKGSISDGTLPVTYYDSQRFVSCHFIFPFADPTIYHLNHQLLEYKNKSGMVEQGVILAMKVGYNKYGCHS